MKRPGIRILTCDDEDFVERPGLCFECSLQWKLRNEKIATIQWNSFNMPQYLRKIAPYTAYMKNGGGAFLIPYFIVAFTSGVPLFFLEVALGQYVGQGCVTCWDICPVFKGIGFGTIVLCNWLNIYYMVVLAYSIFFFGASFISPLPWSVCGQAWNSPNCTTNHSLSKIDIQECLDAGNCTSRTIEVDSVTEFWLHKVLKISPSIEFLGGLNWELAGCLAIAWLLNYFIIWKGVKVSGKIVYFTALFPYVMLFILTIRGLTLPGAEKGLSFYLRPNWSKLAESEVWLDAGTQIFFSYAVSTGALIAMGSYNKFSNDCYRDTWIICLINSATSILSGFCVFSTLGFMAEKQDTVVSEVTKDGPGLAFIAYPTALAQMPWPNFFSVLFFFMLLLLGIDSQFVGIEGAFGAFMDIFPRLRHDHVPEKILGLACLGSFLIGLIMCTEGGMWVFQLFDFYSASGFVLLTFCFFECGVIAWVYGGRKFYRNLELMTGRKIGPYMLISWAFLAPLTSFLIFCLSAYHNKPLDYLGKTYPVWADALGWMLALSSMLCIPGYFFYRLTTANGSTLAQKWVNATTPDLRYIPEEVTYTEKEEPFLSLSDD